MVDLWVAQALIVFGTIFSLELIDRTNMTVLKFASNHSPRAVWVGAALAFSVTTGVAVLAGHLIVTYLGPYLFDVRVAGGIGIIAYGAYCLLKAYRTEEESGIPMDERTTLVQTFLVILALETGDDTQIFTVLFVAWFSNILLVFAAALLALLLVLSIGVTTGKVLRERVEPRLLERVTSLIIIAVGIGTILYAVWYP